MTSAPVHLTGPAADTAHAYGPTLDALRGAVTRSAHLWRNVARPDAPAPGLVWTAAETAAHVVGDLRDYTQALTRQANGYLTHPNRPTESPSRLSAVVNARHLQEVPERDLARLADMLEATADGYLNAAVNVDPTVQIPTPNGLVIRPPTMAALLLGEQLIHGLDIARTANITWPIAAADAHLVIPGVLSVAPQYLRPRAAAGAHVSFELRMRGGPSYWMAVHDGAAVVTAAGERADCVINADPVAFLLLGYGRVGQFAPVLRGQLRPGGRKPWLATKFGKLIATP